MSFRPLDGDWDMFAPCVYRAFEDNVPAVTPASPFFGDCNTRDLWVLSTSDDGLSFVRCSTSFFNNNYRTHIVGDGFRWRVLDCFPFSVTEAVVITLSLWVFGWKGTSKHRKFDTCDRLYKVFEFPPDVKWSAMGSRQKGKIQKER